MSVTLAPRSARVSAVANPATPAPTTVTRIAAPRPRSLPARGYETDTSVGRSRTRTAIAGAPSPLAGEGRDGGSGHADAIGALGLESQPECNCPPKIPWRRAQSLRSLSAAALPEKSLRIGRMSSQGFPRQATLISPAWRDPPSCPSPARGEGTQAASVRRKAARKGRGGRPPIDAQPFRRSASHSAALT
jgi:hypothetical protein